MENTNTPLKLKRQLGVLNAAGIIFSLMCGGGIFIAPKEVILATGSPGLALLLWSFCALIALNGSLCYVALATTFPTSGGDYVYLTELLGKFPAFLYLWAHVNFLRPCANALKCVVFGNYIIQSLTSCGQEENARAGRIIAILMTCLTALVNIVKVKLTADVQSFCVALTTAVLGLITFLGVLHVATAQDGFAFLQPDVSFEGSNWSAEALTLAIYSGVFPFVGWNVLNYVVEEIRQPEKTMPRAVLLAITLISILYIGVNFAYFAVLGPEVVKTSNAVGVDFAHATMGRFQLVVAMAVAITLTSSLSSGILTGSRLLYAGSRNGHFPQLFALINMKFLSPITAIILQTIQALVLIITGDAASLIQIVSFINQAAAFFTLLGYIYRRVKNPDLHSPFRLPLAVHISYMLTLFFLLVVPFVFKSQSVIKGVVLILCTGVPYYVLIHVWDEHHIPQGYLKFYKKLIIVTQKLFYCNPEDQVENYQENADVNYRESFRIR